MCPSRRASGGWSPSLECAKRSSIDGARDDAESRRVHGGCRRTPGGAEGKHADLASLDTADCIRVVPVHIGVGGEEVKQYSLLRSYSRTQALADLVLRVCSGRVGLVGHLLGLRKRCTRRIPPHRHPVRTGDEGPHGNSMMVCVLSATSAFVLYRPLMHRSVRSAGRLGRSAALGFGVARRVIQCNARITDSATGRSVFGRCAGRGATDASARARRPTLFDTF